MTGTLNSGWPVSPAVRPLDRAAYPECSVAPARSTELTVVASSVTGPAAAPAVPVSILYS
jgi:hypothetical protein